MVTSFKFLKLDKAQKDDYNFIYSLTNIYNNVISKQIDKVTYPTDYGDIIVKRKDSEEIAIKLRNPNKDTNELGVKDINKVAENSLIM